MINLRVAGKIFFASYAMAVGGMILVFLLLLATCGSEYADKIWEWYFFIPIYIISLLVCTKFMSIRSD
jgi:hypothetical protein